MILQWHDERIECDKAVQKDTSVRLFDSEDNLIREIFNVTDDEWSHISLSGGDWSNEADIPTREEHLQADIDFLSMENEFLQNENEVLRADLDYCLMLLEE